MVTQPRVRQIQIVLRWFFVLGISLLLSVACLPVAESATPQVTVPTATSQPATAATTQPTLPSPTPAPLPATETAPPSTPAPQTQLLYMLADSSGEYGYSQNGEGYVYSLTLDPTGIPLQSPALLSGSTPIQWARLYPAPNGSSIAVVDSYFGDDVSLLDPLTGQIRRVFGDNLSPGGTFFNWYPDSTHILMWTEKN